MIIHPAACPAEPSRHGIPKQVLLRSGILPGVTQVAVATFSECGEIEPHSHASMYEFFFVLRGRATYRVGEAVLEVGPDDFFFVPPGVTHSLRVTSPPHQIFYWGIATDGQAS